MFIYLLDKIHFMVSSLTSNSSDFNIDDKIFSGSKAKSIVL